MCDGVFAKYPENTGTPGGGPGRPSWDRRGEMSIAQPTKVMPLNQRLSLALRVVARLDRTEDEAPADSGVTRKNEVGLSSREAPQWSEFRPPPASG